MGLNEKAVELAVNLMNTAEYSELKKAKMYIDSNKGLRAELENFNKKQMNIYMDKYSENEAKSNIMELNKRYEELSKIPEVDRYLKASAKFNELLSGAYKIINDTISKSLK